ncbi:unnamed protein product [Effrenium voratum]|uniref:Chloride channel protein n=1 Tax=Effrenium voratum TaxID=2562239 RepID=A0AA36NKL5_9DINO|nr:unnamed protein product [Effrenium voratum]
MDEHPARKHKLRHGPLSYEIFRKVDSLQLHAPYDLKEKELNEARSQSHSFGLREERLAKRLRQFLNVLVGVSVGLTAALVRYGCEKLGDARQGLLLRLVAHEPGWSMGFLRALLVTSGITAACAVLATVAVALVPASSGSGIPGVLAFLNGVDLRSALRGPVLAAKALGTVLAVGGGLALGPEGPMVHIGAIVGMLVCRRCLAPTLQKMGPLSRQLEKELSRQPLRYHVQAAVMGGGAGIAAAFNAPLAGTVFVVEEAASFFSKRLLLHSFVSCAFAVLTSNLVAKLLNLPAESIYARTDACLGTKSWADTGNLHVAFHITVVGVLCGLLAILFNRLVVAVATYWAEEAARIGRTWNLFARRFGFSLFIGALCGAFVLCLPQSGPCLESSLQNAFSGSSGCISEAWLHQLVAGSRSVTSTTLPVELRGEGPRTMSFEPHPGLFGAQYDPVRCPVAVSMLDHCRVPNIQLYFPQGSQLRSTDYCCGFEDYDALLRGEFYNTSTPKAPLIMGESWPRGSCRGSVWDAKNKVFMDHYSPGAALTLVSPTAAVRNLLTRGAPGVLPMSTVASFLVCFFLLAACCSTAWIPGGLLVPMMCIGAAAGRLYGMVWHAILGGASPLTAVPWIPELRPLLLLLYPKDTAAVPVDPGILAFAGCAAFLSGSGSLVMFVLVLLLEVAQEPFLIPVVLISILAARAVASLLGVHGLYHELMNVQSLPFLSETPHWRQGHYVVADLLREDARMQRELPPATFVGENMATFRREDGTANAEFPQLILLSRHANDAEVTDALERRLPGDETQVHGFPVVDQNGQLSGLATRDALVGLLKLRASRPAGSRSFSQALAPSIPGENVEDVMDSAPFVVQASTPVNHAHMLFARCGLRHVVVVDTSHRPIGVLTRKSLMPWRTPWLDEDNLHHDTFLEQRAAHSPTASPIVSRGNSPPSTPPISRQGSYRRPTLERQSSLRSAGGGNSGHSGHSGQSVSDRVRSVSGISGEEREVQLLSPLAESMRLTTMSGNALSQADEAEAEAQMVMHGAEGAETGETGER